MIAERIKAMLQACEGGEPLFPPNELYNEKWLLRVALDWFAEHGGDRYPLSPLEGARWFSEAWLPSAFLPRYRGDKLAEARTHADAVIGHFTIGEHGTAGLSLKPEARQFVLVEAKIFNRLSAGVKNSPGYDQAARSVACIAEVLRRAERDPEDMESLGFVIIAPRARIDDGVFAWEVAADSIRAKVRRRVMEYGGERDAWFRDWFEPTLDRVEVHALSWEDLVEVVAFHDPPAGQFIDSFYGQCLRYNRHREVSRYPGRAAGAARDTLPQPEKPPEPAEPVPDLEEANR
jgi:hypothetical protein